MKSLICFALALLLCSASGSRHTGGYVIRGSFPGLEDGMVAILCDVEGEKREELARDTVRGGRFDLEGRVASPLYAALYVSNADVVPEGVKPKTRYGSHLFLDNSTMELQVAHYDSLPYLTDLFPLQAEWNAQVAGGQTQADYVAYRQALLPLELAAFEVDDTLSNLRFFHKYSVEREKYDAIYAEFYPELAEAEAEVLAARLDFIRRHPQSPVSLWLMEQLAKKEFSLTRAQVDELSLLAAHIPDTVRQPRVLRLLERGRAMCLGGAFPDAEVVNVAGDSLRLSACVQGGRYTLVDMWASWCGACRAAIPMVKQLYAAYPRDRFEVISISFDSKKADWEEAMREEDMPWMQLWVGNERNYNALMRAYNVSSIPRLLLVDPSGNVIFSSYDADALKVVLEQALES